MYWLTLCLGHGCRCLYQCQFMVDEPISGNTFTPPSSTLPGAGAMNFGHAGHFYVQPYWRDPAANDPELQPHPMELLVLDKDLA